jgi:lysophospholipase L1-like esterase
MTGTGARLRRITVAAGRAFRDGWLIIGATALLLVALEAVYRVQGSVKLAVTNRVSPAAEPPSPFDRTDWADDYWIGHAKEGAVLWAPYVYVRNPSFEAPFASVDRLGHRVTPHSRDASAGEPVVRVFFLGGSTTFGWYQRAAHTIPAEAARRLQDRLGDAARVEVTNFGVPGRTFTQSVLELLLQLRAGARPDVVVFYDGINDVMATVQNGRAGLPQNEFNRVADFARGRQVTSGARPGWRNDLRAIGRAALAIGARLQLVRRLLAVRVPGAPPPPDVAALAHNLADIYAENARLVETLAASYGFEPIYVWQPALLSTHKPLTPREAWLRRPEVLTGVAPTRDVHMTVPALISSAMAPIAADRFIDLTTLFDTDPLDIYVDLFGHTYERANPRIVESMMPALSRAAARAAGPAASAR